MQAFRFQLWALAAATAILSACASEPAADVDGQALFLQHCAACHGPFAEGDGPVASVLSVSVPNLRSLAARSGGRFPRQAVISYIDGRDAIAAHGTRTMPVWGDTFAIGEDGSPSNALARQRIEAIAGFVEALQN